MKTMIITTIFSVLGMLCMSCSDLSSINSDIADLDKRISVLEESITAVNDNAVAVKALMDKSIIILDYTKQEYGWTLVLNDGTALKVTDGISAPVLVPIIGVDRNGRWIMSTDAGKTFTTIANSTASDAGDGRTPQISTDDSGYWIISFDGTSWNRILDSEGNPINARDGREVAGGYAFFSSVTYDQDNENMQFHLITGEQLTVPVLKNGGIYVEGYADKDIVFPGRKIRLRIIHESPYIPFRIRDSNNGPGRAAAVDTQGHRSVILFQHVPQQRGSAKRTAKCGRSSDGSMMDIHRSLDGILRVDDGHLDIVVGCDSTDDSIHK